CARAREQRHERRAQLPAAPGHEPMHRETLGEHSKPRTLDAVAMAEATVRLRSPAARCAPAAPACYPLLSSSIQVGSFSPFASFAASSSARGRAFTGPTRTRKRLPPASASARTKLSYPRARRRDASLSALARSPNAPTWIEKRPAGAIAA